MTFSDATINRLPLYLRELQQMLRNGHSRVQSSVLARRLGLNDSQVRRDLSGFGSLGQRGVGYEIRGLIRTIHEALGGDRKWNVVLVGVGNLGTALSGYRGFGEQGYRLVAALDVDERKVGTKLDRLIVRHLDEIDDVVQREGVELAILSVPASVAPMVAQRLELAGITGILNFAPVTVKKPQSSATVVNVDLAVELQRLAYAVLRSKETGE